MQSSFYTLPGLGSTPPTSVLHVGGYILRTFLRIYGYGGEERKRGHHQRNQLQGVRDVSTAGASTCFYLPSRGGAPRAPRRSSHYRPPTLGSRSFGAMCPEVTTDTRRCLFVCLIEWRHSPFIRSKGHSEVKDTCNRWCLEVISSTYLQSSCLFQEHRTVTCIILY